MYYDDDFVGDDEYDDLMDACRESFARDVVNHIKKNKDDSAKHIGDIVLVWDTSRLTEFGQDEVNTDELDHQLIAKFPSIVIAEDQKYNQDIVLGEDRVYPCNLDLIIWNKTLGKKYRTSSSFVKITTNKV